MVTGKMANMIIRSGLLTGGGKEGREAGEGDEGREGVKDRNKDGREWKKMCWKGENRGKE